MSDENITSVSVSFPPDENGFTGRKCPNEDCGKYFKIKCGTGLPTELHICPYCTQRGTANDFITGEQLEYAKSVALKQALGPALAKMDKSFKDLERSTRGGLIQIKVKTSGNALRLKHYQEKELETHVTCDACQLEFAVYGVFATCPDCSRLNALVIFIKSIEVAKRRLKLLDTIDKSDGDLVESILDGAVSGGVSSFDGYGKALRNNYPAYFPSNPRNLFQNLRVLSENYENQFNETLGDLIGDDEFNKVNRMFNVRHVYEHNMGVVDQRFVNNVENSESLLGRKYPLNREEIETYLDCLKELGKRIDKKVKESVNGSI